MSAAQTGPEADLPPVSGRTQALPSVSLSHIVKRYGSLLANDDVSIDIAEGSIHGIVGENGAGKSTLMKILAGWETPDGGEIRLSGKPVSLRNSAQAAGHGISMIFQHFMMVERLTVLDNLLLHNRDALMLRRGRRALAERLQAVMRTYELPVPLDVPFEELPLGLRQRAELLKALLGQSRIIILDEPTAVLTPREVDRFFDVLRQLRDEGRTILFVTHKLHEVMALCDRVTVMRQAKVVGTLDVSEVTPQSLAELMIGRSDLELDQTRTATDSGPCVSLRNLKYVSRGICHVDLEALEIGRGEIVGIAGVSGNGQSELLDILSGQLAPTEGSMTIAGNEFTDRSWPNALDARRFGIGNIPEDRHGTGLLLDLPIWVNLVFGYEYRPQYSRGGVLNIKAQRETASRLIDEFDIRPATPETKVRMLSGGNQQKIVVAREVHAAPTLLLVGQPTRGVDIGSIQNIHGRLLNYRNDGGSVLLVSSELEELFALCDRLTVAFGGRFHGNFPRQQFGDPRIGRFMAGVFE